MEDFSRKSGSTFGDSTSFRHSSPLIDDHSSYVVKHSNHSVPLSAKVGSRTSFHSRPTSSIQTTKQLEEYLQKRLETYIAYACNIKTNTR